MLIEKIIVENFRNIKFAELTFSDKINIFLGNNAQGKTNLLEAVSIALGKSFRSIKKGEIIPFDSQNGMTTRISLFYMAELNPGKVNKIVYEQNSHRNVVTVNSIPLKKAADLYGEFKYVVFIPDNLNIIKGYPDIRRFYLDNIAIMQNKSHRKFLQEYKNALKQRCAAHYNEYNDSQLLQVWDDILIRQGINLTYGRLKYLNLIKEYAGEIYGELSGGESLRIEYDSNVFGDFFGNLSDESDFDFFDSNEKSLLYGKYSQKLQSADSKGLSAKTPGAHRDDIVFSINGNNSRNYGSQGQLKSIAVSLKLAESRIIRDFNKENPVVLLDEVLSELDSKRRSFVIRHFVDSQTFITSCNENELNNLSNAKVWNVENGEFTVFTSRE